MTNAKHGDQALLGMEGIVDVDDNIENVEGAQEMKKTKEIRVRMMLIFFLL